MQGHAQTAVEKIVFEMIDQQKIIVYTGGMRLTAHGRQMPRPGAQDQRGRPRDEWIVARSPRVAR